MQGPPSAEGGQMFNPYVLFFVFGLIKHDAFVTADAAERLLRRLRLLYHQLHAHTFKDEKKDSLIHF